MSLWHVPDVFGHDVPVDGSGPSLVTVAALLNTCGQGEVLKLVAPSSVLVPSSDARSP